MRLDPRLAALALLGSIAGCDAMPNEPEPVPARQWAYADAEKRPGASPPKQAAKPAATPDPFPPAKLPESLCPKRVEPLEPTMRDGSWRLRDKTGFEWQSIDRQALIDHVRKINERISR